MRDCELDEREWMMVGEMVKVLKVRALTYRFMRICCLSCAI